MLSCNTREIAFRSPLIEKLKQYKYITKLKIPGLAKSALWLHNILPEPIGCAVCCNSLLRAFAREEKNG